VRAAPVVSRATVRRYALISLVSALGAAYPGTGAWSQPPTLSIVSPKPGETVHDNTGDVAVLLAIGAGADGGRIRVLLDGKRHGRDREAHSFLLTGVERGEHVLQVQLLDAAGAPVASSEAVKFHLWQASRLFPSRQ